MQTTTGHLITMMHDIRTLLSQMKPQSDITFGEYCVLSMISDGKSGKSSMLTPTSLNELLKTKKPATSRMLAVLEKKGYVVRDNDMKDHRICYLSLTKEGEQVLNDARVTFEQLTQRITDKMGEQGLLQMEASIQKLSEFLEEEVKAV